MQKNAPRMPAAANPVYANVAFLRIQRFEARPVVEQASLKEHLEAKTKAAIGAVPAADRVVLDTDDGLAVVFFGDPARALDVTQAIHASCADHPIKAGLNHGPLALTTRGSDARVFGDGLTAAAAAARFASPEKILVTQDFAKALEHRSPERAVELATAGDFTDTRVRLHSFFTPDPKLGAMHRRRMLALGAGGVAGILLLGVAAREARRLLFTPLPAVVKFVVKPRGEVFVDGVSKGRTPPIQEIEVPAGSHVVQIRNPGYPPLEITLDLRAGERTTIAHTFVRPPPPPKPPPQPDFWRDLKKRFGG